jgi:hypothetical protein
MRLLKKNFGRKREKERIETLGKIFPYSRAEDMAKVFELGRIHALRQCIRSASENQNHAAA